MRSFAPALMTFLLMLFGAFVLPTVGQNLRTVDYPAASDTYLTAINSQGDVAGYYIDSGGEEHGFFKRGHTFREVLVPIGLGATYPWGIDDNYNVVGYYVYYRGFTAGFRAGPDHSRQLYVVYNSEYSPVFNITPTTGVVSGTCQDCASGNLTGFYYLNGQYSYITHPDTCCTTVTGENDQGQFVGNYFNGFDTVGFVYDGVSVFTDIDYPGSTSTTPNRISNSGEIVGTYQLSDEVNHGFTYINQTFQSVDFPGATDTQIFGVNTSGEVVGRYTDAKGVTHGFIGTP